MFDFKPKTVYNWYRNYLSDYTRDIAAGTWNNKKVYEVDQQTGEIRKEKTVYIAQQENVGERMTIDDKQIGKSSYTIMTNSETGKIAFIMDSVKADELKEGVKFLGNKLQDIKHISSDMAPSYLKFCSEVIPQSKISIDKFHVMQYVYDAVGDVRNRIRKSVLLQMPKGKRKPEDEGLLSDLELLKKTRHLLNQSRLDWNCDQSQIMDVVFQKFPELNTAYNLAQNFKTWYSKSNMLNKPIVLETKLYQWFDQVEQSKLKEFDSCVKMIEKHQDNISNHFICAHTNAKAENMNGKIQRFVSNNFGVRDKDFFLYRIKIYFS